MNLTLDPAELRPVVEAVVAEVLRAMPVGNDGRLAYLESEAAELLGLRSHQLRDARLRGEITATKIGGRIGYEKNELVAYLARGRDEH